MKLTRRLRICIDARLRHGMAGGVEQVVLGLANGLARLRDGDEEYLFLVSPGEEGWLLPHLGAEARVLAARVPSDVSVRARAAAMLPALARAYGNVHDLVLPPPVPRSDGTLEGSGADLVHFTFQDGFRTSVPSIYQPHDLQHVHLPQFFTLRQRRARDATYSALCAQAAVVAVSSTWVKEDVVRHLRLPSSKVQVVPLAPIVDHYAEPGPDGTAETLRRHALPDAFALYPAQTWPHKNHHILLEAVALLRERHRLVVPLVFPGRRTEYAETIAARARQLGIDPWVHLIGFVSPEELQALYRAARCAVIPTLFEAASFPLWEAFRNGLPAACSDVTSLPAQAGDAALLFDPRDVSSVARALQAIWTDEPLRARLAASGRERVSAFTWERTGRVYRALYRRVARRATAEDDALLEAPPAL
jgi:glycosyltransferase involved in cell wall biosynthesis